MFWAKYCPKQVELILYINKSLLHLIGSSVLQYFLFTFKAEDETSYLAFAQEAKVFVESEPGGMQKGFVQLLNPLQHTKTCSYHAD